MFIAGATHTLYQLAPVKEDGKGYKEKGPDATKEGGRWEEVEVERESLEGGGIGEVYAAFAGRNKDLVDFDVAVKRHKMVQAIFCSAKNGTREKY